MDILQLEERIQKTIELGESQFREFKSCLEGLPSDKKLRDPKAVAKDITETLVAFANADGGELLVGVENDGIITGLPYQAETISKLLEAPKRNTHPDTPLESLIERQVTLDNKPILYFAIEKSTRTIHQTSDGKCLQRKDRENRPVSAVQLQFEREEQISREYDRHFVDRAQVFDLDLESINRVSDYLTPGMSPEKCLQYLGLTEYGIGMFRLRRAALLLFAKDVSHWHPRCQVRVVRVRGTELKTGRGYNVISDETATGNILELISLAWEKLRPHLVETKLTPEAIFKEKVMYPEDACREALINAIAHRNYSIEGQNIEILIFDDRMEVNSPGGLLSTIKIEELTRLTGIHESRNAFIARVLRHIGYVRELGEGIRRIFNLMRDADLVPPELHSQPSKFSIILHYKSVFSDMDQRWLDGFKPLKLTREEILIALLGKDGNLLSPQQIYNRLNLVDWDVYRSIIEQIQTKGILYNALSEQEKRKLSYTKRISKREVPRLIVRQPEECERALTELLTVIQGKESVPSVSGAFIGEILQSLPYTNSYRTNPTRLTRLLGLLGLIDASKEPTTLMRSLWGKEPTPVSTLMEQQSKSFVKPSLRFKTPTAQKIIARSPRKIFVGNLDYNTTPEELKAFFSQCGEVVSVTIPTDFVTQRGRGFAFVIMLTQVGVEYAIQEMNGKLLRGRSLRLSF